MRWLFLDNAQPRSRCIHPFMTIQNALSCFLPPAIRQGRRWNVFCYNWEGHPVHSYSEDGERTTLMQLENPVTAPNWGE